LRRQKSPSKVMGRRNSETEDNTITKDGINSDKKNGDQVASATTNNYRASGSPRRPQDTHLSPGAKVAAKFREKIALSKSPLRAKNHSARNSFGEKVGCPRAGSDTQSEDWLDFSDDSGDEAFAAGSDGRNSRFSPPSGVLEHDWDNDGDRYNDDDDESLGLGPVDGLLMEQKPGTNTNTARGKQLRATGANINHKPHTILPSQTQGTRTNPRSRSPQTSPPEGSGGPPGQRIPNFSYGDDEDAATALFSEIRLESGSGMRAERTNAPKWASGGGVRAPTKSSHVKGGGPKATLTATTMSGSGSGDRKAGRGTDGFGSCPGSSTVAASGGRARPTGGRRAEDLRNKVAFSARESRSGGGDGVVKLPNGAMVSASGAIRLRPGGRRASANTGHF
jgi:hypothetical protein